MADDQDKDSKTEDPTEKKISEALEKGNTPFSREVTYVVSLATIALVTLIYAPSFTNDVAKVLRTVFANSHDWSLDSSETVYSLMFFLVGTIGLALLPIILPLVVFGLISSFAQNQPRMVLDRIQPKFERVSLAKGLKRLLGTHSLKEFAKSLFKFGSAGIITMFITMYHFDWVMAHILMDAQTIPSAVHVIFVQAIMGLILFVAVMGGVDFVWTRREWYENLRMTHQEVKEERKQAEGDQNIKMRTRSIARDRARNQMMKNVPQATMVLANPTHFSVALRYEPEIDGAPMVLAKGQDIIALKIREIAEENDIPIIEDKPLARSLYKACNVDQEIPLEFYVPIARIVRILSEKENKSFS